MRAPPWARSLCGPDRLSARTRHTSCFALGVRTETRADVTIVGGGLAGLSCAVALGDAGLRVFVLEASDCLGGRARSWTHAPSGDVVDIGPHVVHSEYRNFLGLLDRLGTREAIAWQPRKLITLLTERGPRSLCHRALPPPLSLLPDMLRIADFGWRDAFSNLRPSWRALRFDEAQGPVLDAMSGLDFLRGCGTSERMIDWFWRFAAMVVMNVPLERCSAAALLRVHSQLIGHRGLHFGFPRVGLSALYVPQATRAIAAAGGTVRLNTRVARLDRAEGGHRIVLDGGEELLSPYAVLAVPPAELGRVLRDGVNTRAFEPSPYKSVYLWFDRPLAVERFWALLWSPERLNYDFYDLTRIRPELAGRPALIASNIIYSHRAACFSDEEIVRRTCAEIALFAPQAMHARVLHADVHDIPMAIPCPLPGTESKRPPTRCGTPRLFLAGDWTRTQLPCSMESAVRSGLLAAEAVLEDLGRPQRLAAAPRPNDGLAGWVAPRARRA